MAQPQPKARRLPKKANSDWRKLLQAARRAGWTASHTHNSHIRLSKPGHRDQILSLQSSDPRALRNMRATLARVERTARAKADPGR